jgi:hypothetical protein
MKRSTAFSRIIANLTYIRREVTSGVTEA